MRGQTTKAGVKTKLLGVIVLFIAILDAMLSWRGGPAAGNFHLALFAAGLFIYAVGAVRQSSGKHDQEIDQ